MTAPNSAMACSGWRRSWLAAARKRVFSSLARWVAAIWWLSCSASASFSKRMVSAAVSSRWCCSAKMIMTPMYSRQPVARNRCTVSPRQASARVRLAMLGTMKRGMLRLRTASDSAPPAQPPIIMTMTMTHSPRLRPGGTHSQGARPQTQERMSTLRALKRAQYSGWAAASGLRW
ncbi:hypothetical protein D3C71_1273910 [compost metagenome]